MKHKQTLAEYNYNLRQMALKSKEVNDEKERLEKLNYEKKTK